MGPGSGLQDPRELQEKSGIRESGQEGSAGGFKILVFCRPGDRSGKKKNKRALQGASRSWCSAGRGTEREKKEQNNRKKEQQNTRATWILRCGGQLH